MIIVKVGGGDSLNLDGIVADLARLEQPFMVIHGANALRDRIAKQMGYNKQVITSLSGYSSVLSDETALDSILMAYSGLRNKRLVELCQQNGINALGLCNSTCSHIGAAELTVADAFGEADCIHRKVVRFR